MKNTLVSLLLASGMAMGVGLQDAAYTSTTDITGISDISGSFAYTLSFNVDAMKGILGNNGAVRPMLVVADNDHDMGLAMALNNTGFVGEYECHTDMSNLTMGGGGEEHRQPLTESGSSPATNNFADSTVGGNLTSKFDMLSGLALTFSHTDTVSSSLFVTLTFTDGSVSELYGSKAGFKWDSGVGDLLALNINEDYIDTVYLFSGAVDKETAMSLNRAAIVPEPTSTILGVLALGGLALRRRRR